jgi:hypothetical protein
MAIFKELLIIDGFSMDMISYVGNILSHHTKLRAVISTINFLA